MFELAKLYDSIPDFIDRKKALDLFRRVAAGGEPNAMAKIGFYYRDGTVVAKDYVKASAWIALALKNAQHGLESPDATKSGYQFIQSRLSASQRADAKRLATAWKQGTSKLPAPRRTASRGSGSSSSGSQGSSRRTAGGGQAPISWGPGSKIGLPFDANHCVSDVVNDDGHHVKFVLGNCATSRRGVLFMGCAYDNGGPGRGHDTRMMPRGFRCHGPRLVHQPTNSTPSHPGTSNVAGASLTGESRWAGCFFPPGFNYNRGIGKREEAAAPCFDLLWKLHDEVNRTNQDPKVVATRIGVGSQTRSNRGCDEKCQCENAERAYNASSRNGWTANSRQLCLRREQICAKVYAAVGWTRMNCGG